MTPFLAAIVALSLWGLWHVAGAITGVGDMLTTLHVQRYQGWQAENVKIGWSHENR